MPNPERFVICVSNEGCDDLEELKAYRVLPDERASEDGLIRVIDESGEDYLYPADRFIPIELSSTQFKRLIEVASH